MDVNKDQLVEAIAQFKKAEAKARAAANELQVKTQQLKTSCASTANDGPTVYTEALRKLGTIHWDEIQKDL